MVKRISVITLGVRDLDRSIRFYREGLGLTLRDDKPPVAYFPMDGSWLALYPRDQLARFAGVEPDGGGFSGVATALTLAERGITNVVVLEAQRIGWGASGRNGGQLIGGVESEKRLRRVWGPRAADILRLMRYRGHEIIDERIRKYRIECDLARGAITAATKPATPALMCTTVPPAKSSTPQSPSQPPPHTQWQTGA